MTEVSLFSCIFLQAIKDWHLGLVVAAITLVDLVLLVVVAALPHALNPAQLVRNQEQPFEEKGVSTKLDIYLAVAVHTHLTLVCL